MWVFLGTLPDTFIVFGVYILHGHPPNTSVAQVATWILSFLEFQAIGPMVQTQSINEGTLINSGRVELKNYIYFCAPAKMKSKVPEIFDEFMEII